jgi:hypothetical protein
MTVPKLGVAKWSLIVSCIVAFIVVMSFIFTNVLSPNTAEHRRIETEVAAVKEKAIMKEDHEKDVARIETRLDRMELKLDKQHDEIMMAVTGRRSSER